VQIQGQHRQRHQQVGLIAALAIGLLLAACMSDPTPASTPLASLTRHPILTSTYSSPAAPPTATPTDTPTASPTVPPSNTPTLSPTPTRTRYPTLTPRPTAKPRPTATPPPTPLPHPALKNLWPDDSLTLLDWPDNGRAILVQRQKETWELDIATGEVTPALELVPTSANLDLAWIDELGFFVIEQHVLPGSQQVFLFVLSPPPQTEPHRAVLLDYDGVFGCVKCHAGDLAPGFNSDVLLVKATGPAFNLPLFEGWVANTDGSDLQKIFVSDQSMSFTAPPQGPTLFTVQICYGNLLPFSEGAWLIDIDKPSAKLIDEQSFWACEGSTWPKFSPDGTYLAVAAAHTFLIRTDGSQKHVLCSAHVFAWSQDSRYLYYACRDETYNSDVLWRYNTSTDSTEQLTDPDKIQLKVLQMVPSPDQSQIAFLWGSGWSWNSEPFGLWLLDLTKLSD
jgi:hypothetical protein